jgi:NADH-quinone oxidoreductase subunit L
MLLIQSLCSFAPIALIMHCLFIFLFKRWLGPIGTFYASLLSFSFVLLCSLNELYQILLHGNYVYVDFGRWFFCLDLIDSHLVFCIDSLSLVSSALVLTLTMFALYFGVEYMYREAFINRLLYLLNLFATSVVFLFYCYDYFLILFSWECIGLFSFLLVNFYSSRIYTIKAALKTFVFSRISDLFMFFAFLLTVNTFNTTDLSLIFLQIPFLAFHYIFIGDTAIHFITLFSFCLVTSGGIKGAQFFFHVWLPDAMEAPTPASALIHSSTLVVAGVFLVIRFSILFEFTVFTNYYMALWGALTLSFGAITATFQNDIKKLVAYSTISQIGYLMCGCGFCCYEEVLIYLIIHALNKAFLFVLVGYTVHFFSGNTDMRQMGGAYLYSFDIAVLLFGCCFNLAGLPYSAGFLGKEFLLLQVLRDDFLSLFVRGCWLVSFFFTPIYMFTLVFLVMFGPKKGSIVAYISSWDYHLKDQSFGTVSCSTNLYQSLSHRFQFTVVTSRLTSYFLLSFWLFFFFYGETLLLVVFNYSTPVDTITSSAFFTIKQHVIFLLTTTPHKLITYINFYIFLLTSCAFCYLINLNYSYNYNYFRNNSFNSGLVYALVLVMLFF